MKLSLLRPVAFFLILGLIGCGKNGQIASIFPESQSTGSSNGGSGGDGPSPSDQCSAQRISSEFIVQWKDGKRTLEKFSDSESFIEEFLQPQIEKIAHVEFNKYVQKYQNPIRLFGVPEESTELSPLALKSQWNMDMVQASAGWDQGFKGQSITVAIIDAPVNHNHPQLKPQLLVNPAEVAGSSTDNDGNGYPGDVYGWDFVDNRPVPLAVPASEDHGSHVAGIVAASPVSGGISGIAPMAKLIPVSFIGTSAKGEETGTIENAIKAIEYAASRGVKVINASWGGSACSPALEKVLSDLGSKNILFVMAAGNESADFDLSNYRVYPATYNFGHTLTVAATTKNDFLAWFSNRSSQFVEIAAPGSEIESTVGSSQTAIMEGTSMASPLVAGAAAVVWSVRPQATATQVRQALLNSVDVKSASGLKVVTRGRLNLARAIDEIRRLVP